MKHIRNFKKNNLILLLIFILFFISYILFNKIYDNLGEPYLVIGLRVLISILFGLVLSVDHFLNEREKEGKWTLNKYRIIYISLPFFLLSLYPVIYYIYPISIFPYQIDSIIIVTYNNLFQTFPGIILGYSIISALYKK